MVAGLAVSGSEGHPEDDAAANEAAADALLASMVGGVDASADSARTTGGSSQPQPYFLQVRWRLCC